jgi:F420-dependent oxidoreductase-like protein
MRIGLQVPSFTWPGGDAAIRPTFANIVRRAEDAGFYSLWVMDHFFQIRGVGQPEEPMLEGYSALNFAAAITERIKLGTMVTGVIYRHPGLLVKTVTTLDVLSGGRAYCGIGAAWNEDESRGLGVPFPSIKERFEKLEEALQIAHQMWKGDRTPFEGKYSHLENPINSPQAISKPHPPILIGGMGEQKTLRMVAQYGDACNFFGRMGTEVLQQKIDVLKAHCEKLGRNYDDIEKTTLNTFEPEEMSTQQVIETLREQAAMGFTQAIFNMRDIATMKPLDILANEVIPAVSEF